MPLAPTRASPDIWAGGLAAWEREARLARAAKRIVFFMVFLLWGLGCTSVNSPAAAFIPLRFSKRRGAGEGHGLSTEGMGKGQAGGVQAQASAFPGLAVEPVSQDGMAEGLHMDPQLMGAAGDRLQFDAGGVSGPIPPEDP